MKENQLITVLRLAKQVKTPFYAAFEEEILENYNYFLRNLSSIEKWRIFYPIKTNSESGVLSCIRKLGMGAHVASSLDLLLARENGFEYKDIIVDNLYNLRDSLNEIVSNKVHRIYCWSWDQIEHLNFLAKQKNKVLDVGIKLNPFPLHRDPLRRCLEKRARESGFLFEEVADSLSDKIKKLENLTLKSLSLYLDLPYPVSHKEYCVEIRNMFKLISGLKNKGLFIDELNIGGGFPCVRIELIRQALHVGQGHFFVKRKRKIREEGFLKSVVDCFLLESRKLDLSPVLCLEPGRSVVESSGIIVGRALEISKRQIIVDITLDELGYCRNRNRKFHIFSGDKGTERKKINICGIASYSRDVLFRSVKVTGVSCGDIIVIFNTGAYCIARSVRHFTPGKAVYFIDSSGKVFLNRKEETCEEFIKYRRHEPCGPNGLACRN
ncbi:MAG: hypothetical protein KJ818_04570 [Candidatus Omnitrophica bacterium]|nr:hypothetical protein [Candidatus Omnitrophota bacterium]